MRGPLTALALLKMEIESGVCSGLLSASRFTGLVDVDAVHEVRSTSRRSKRPPAVAPLRAVLSRHPP